MAQALPIRWHLIFLVSFGTLVLLVFAHVLFVAYYSHLMNPVLHDEAFYREFAAHTGAPFVFFFAPLPIFLAVRWVGQKSPDRALVHGAIIAAILLTLDVAIVAVAGQLGSLLQPGMLLAHAAKTAAAVLGGWSVQVKD